MSSTGVLFMWRTVTNMAINNDQSGTIFGLLKIAIGIAEHLQIVGIGNVSDVPSISLKTQAHVLAERPVRGTIQSYVIVIVNPTEIGKLQMSSQRSCMRFIFPFSNTSQLRRFPPHRAEVVRWANFILQLPATIPEMMISASASATPELES